MRKVEKFVMIRSSYCILFVVVVVCMCALTQAQSALSKQTETVVPYFISKDSHVPLITIQLDTKTIGFFMVDTGSNWSFLSKHMIERLNLTVHKSASKDFTTGLPGKEVLLSYFKLGTIPLIHKRFAPMPDNKISQDPNLPIDGVIGTDILSDYAVYFDFGSHQIHFFSPGLLSSEDLMHSDMADAVVLPMTINDLGLFTVPVRINGYTETALNVDTGLEGTVIPANILTQAGARPDNQQYALNTFFGRFVANEYLLDKLTLGSLTLKNQPVLGLKEVHPVATNLGRDVLTQFQVLFDFPAMKLYLKPRAAAPLPTTEPVIAGNTVKVRQVVSTPMVFAGTDNFIPCFHATLEDGKPNLLALSFHYPAALLDSPLEAATHPQSTSGNTLQYPPGVRFGNLKPVPMHDPANSQHVFFEIPFSFRDLTAARQQLPGIVGVLGNNILPITAVHLDWGEHRIDFITPSNLHDTPEEPRDAVRVPLRFLNNQVVIAGTIDGKPTQFVLSTMNETLLADPTISDLHPVKSLGTTSKADGSLDVAGMVRLHEITIGGVRWSQPAVQKQSGAPAGTPNILGLDLLRIYRITLDVGSNSLYLEPDPRYKPDPMFGVGTGIQRGRDGDGKLRVIGLAVPSSAQEAGVLAGDEIVSVNGLQVGSTSGEKIEMAFKQPEGSEITVITQRKGEDKPREFKLKVRKLL